MSERIRRRLELRRSSAASPHRNKTRFHKSSRNDWKGLVMSDTMEGFSMEDIVVQREGSSQRTVEELSRVFVSDVADLAYNSNVPRYGEAKSLDSEAQDTDDPEALDDIVRDAEDILSDLGYYVEWNDGYTIFKA